MHENNLEVIAKHVGIDFTQMVDEETSLERWQHYRAQAQDLGLVDEFDNLTATLAATARSHGDYLQQRRKQFESERRSMALSILTSLRLQQ